MMDDNQIRPHAETPDFPVERTELPEWRQVPGDQDASGRITSGGSADASARTGAGYPDGVAQPDGAAQPDATQGYPGEATQGYPLDDTTSLEPRRIPAPTGPAWGTIAFGMVCLSVAGAALALQFVDLTLDWRYVAPLAFAGVGAILVLVGLIGLAGRRGEE